MANEKLITKEEALLRVKSEDIERLFYPVIDVKVDRKSLASKILATASTPSPAPLLARLCSPRRKQRSGPSAAKRSSWFARN